MPLMTNIVLSDAASPPVEHTFAPTTLSGNTGTYQDQSLDRVAEWPVITGSFRSADATNIGQKARWKLVMPLPVDTSGPCCTDANTPPTSFFTIEFVRNKVATNQQNEDLIAYLQALVTDAQFLATLRGQGLR